MDREPVVLRHKRQNLYISCEEMDFTWDERDVIEFDRMWREGKGIDEISEAFRRDPDEIAILIIDRSKNGHIKRRKGGVYGNDRALLDRYKPKVKPRNTLRRSTSDAKWKSPKEASKGGQAVQ